MEGAVSVRRGQPRAFEISHQSFLYFGHPSLVVLETWASDLVTVEVDMHDISHPHDLDWVVVVVGSPDRLVGKNVLMLNALENDLFPARRVETGLC